MNIFCQFKFLPKQKYNVKNFYVGENKRDDLIKLEEH